MALSVSDHRLANAAVTAPLQAGFTYIGLIALVAVIAVASAATVTVGALAQRRQVEEEMLFVGSEYIRAFMLYDSNTPDGNGDFAPKKLEDLLKDPRLPGTMRYLRKLYPDPITGKADWELIPAPGGGIMGVKSASCQPTIKRSFTEQEWLFLNDKKRYCDWVFAWVIACGANCSLATRPEGD